MIPCDFTTYKWIFVPGVDGGHSSTETVQRTMRVNTIVELDAAIEEALLQRPVHFDVDILPYENTLGVGVDESIGCIMFQKRSGDSTYRMVVEDLDAPDEYFEFDVGGTPTPISLRRCIPIERLVSLVKYYFLNGAFPEGTEWEED